MKDDDDDEKPNVLAFHEPGNLYAHHGNSSNSALELMLDHTAANGVNFTKAGQVRKVLRKVLQHTQNPSSGSLVGEFHGHPANKR